MPADEGILVAMGEIRRSHAASARPNRDRGILSKSMLTRSEGNFGERQAIPSVRNHVCSLPG